MESSDNGDDHRNPHNPDQRPLPIDGEAASSAAGARGYLRAFFDKPSGNPCARAQDAEERDAQPQHAAYSERATSARQLPDKRPGAFQREAVYPNVGQRVSLQAFFDKPSGNPCARAHVHDENDGETYNAARSVRSASQSAILRDREILQNPYAHVDGEGNFRALPNTKRPQSRTSTAAGPAPLSINPAELLKKRRRGKKYRNSEVEDAARALQRTLWRNRQTLFPGSKMSNPMKFLDPSLAIRCLGMSFEVCESLGQYSDSNGRFEVAGQIDPQSRQVRISRQFLPHVQEFTAAHELGHAVLHAGSALHRDRALDGSGKSGGRDRREIEADRFAAAFLMPAKQIGLQFASRFHTTKLILDDDTAFGIASQNQDSLRTSIRELRDWSRMVADASFYQGKHFVSLAEQFGVSVETMAIRIEELDLIGL